MDKRQIFEKVDHTLLTQTARWEEIKEICDDAIEFQVASVCIPPSYVKRVKEYVKDQMAICTVIGFPNGYNSTEVKVFETKKAISEGADEIDMVINLGLVKDKEYEKIYEEIRQIKDACGEHILKVIIETCLLTEEEKIKMCDVVSDQVIILRLQLDFQQRATLRILNYSQHVKNGVKIKVWGLLPFEDAQKLLNWVPVD